MSGKSENNLRRRQLLLAAAVGAGTLVAVLSVPGEWVTYFTLAGMAAVMVVLFVVGAVVAVITGKKSGKRKRGNGKV